MQPFLAVETASQCNLNLDYCNTPGFNPSKSYQKNTLCPGPAVILRIVESLIKGIKSVADVISLWFSQALTRNQTNSGAMRNSSLTLHTELPILHKAIWYFSKWINPVTTTEIHSKAPCTQPPKTRHTWTTESHGFCPELRGDDTYDTQLLE